jgi:hypothetical protein
MQIAYFQRWRRDLATLAKRGAPIEFIQQLQEMGPEKGIPIIEGLLQGSDKQFNGIVKKWKRTQDLINAATKKDMDDQLADWQRHGTKIALKIIEGVISEPAQAALRNGFRKYVVGTFGEVLKRDMRKEVAEAMAEAIRAAARSKAVDAAAEAAGKAAAAKIGKSMQTGVGGGGAGRGAGRPGAGPDFSAMRAGQLPPRGIVAELARINRRQAEIARQAREARPGVPPSRRLSPEQQRELVQLQTRENRILAARREFLRRERASVREQLQLWERWGPISRGEHRGEYKITYQGDTIYIKADGATVQAVMRALNKKKFQQKSKHPKKQPQRRGK